MNLWLSCFRLQDFVLNMKYQGPYEIKFKDEVAKENSPYKRRQTSRHRT